MLKFRRNLCIQRVCNFCPFRKSFGGKPYQITKGCWVDQNQFWRFLPLPTHKKIFTVLRSPHVNKKSREQFQLCAYKRLLDIYSSSSKTIDALMKLELPSGVEVEIKV